MKKPEDRALMFVVYLAGIFMGAILSLISVIFNVRAIDLSDVTMILVAIGFLFGLFAYSYRIRNDQDS